MLPIERKEYQLPDLAGDCEKTNQIMLFALKKFSLINYVLTYNSLAEALSHLLETKTTGVQRDFITTALVDTVSDMLEEELENLAYNLSLELNMEILPLRTEAGLLYLLRKNNIEVKTLSEKFFKELPGNHLNTYLYTIYKLIQLEEYVLSGKFIVKVTEIWDTTPRLKNFDETVIKLTASEPAMERVCWAILKFESNKHTNLVWHEANKLERSLPNRSSDDLLAYGYMGLRTALRLYDPTLGFRFSTYACARINGTIRDGVRAESPIPKRLTTFQRKVAAAEAELQQVLGRYPSIEEVAKKIGEDIDKFSILPKLAPEASIDNLSTDDDGRHISNSWEISNDDPSLLVIANFQHSLVTEAITSLHEDEQLVISYIMNDEISLNEIARIMNKDNREIRILRDRAYIKLRKALYNLAD